MAKGKDVIYRKNKAIGWLIRTDNGVYHCYLAGDNPHGETTPFASYPDRGKAERAIVAEAALRVGAK